MQDMVLDEQTKIRKALTSEFKEKIGCTISMKPVLNKEPMVSSSDQVDQKLPFTCDTCKKVFTKKYMLLRHMNLHLEKKPSKCDNLCTTKSALQDDMLIHPKTSATYKCEKCSKTFSRKNVLVRHMKFHLEKKPFNCKMCSKSFVQKSDLQKHNLVHSKQGVMHKCNQCDKKFSREKNLINHTMIHNTPQQKQRHIEPFTRHYKCVDCSEIFNHRFDLVKHRKIHLSPKEHISEQRTELLNHLQNLLQRIDTLQNAIKNETIPF